MKLCKCKEDHAPYWDSGIFKCQYCMGVLTNLERCRKIIAFNTSADTSNRKEIIDIEISKQNVVIDKIRQSIADRGIVK